MSGISGSKKEQKEFGKLKVGLAEVKVIAINPNIEDYKEVLGIELKDDSKATEYLGESKENNTTLRVDVWVEDVKDGNRNKIVFFLENKKKENKDGTKHQYINNVGTTSWADDAKNLPSWFKTRPHRIAFVGEEELYGFLKVWLGTLDLKKDDSVLELDWKALMKGNVKELVAQIDGEFTTNFVAPYTVKTVEKEDGVKHYQSFYNKGFLPAYSLKNFRLVDYNKSTEQSRLRAKAAKDLKPHEKFVVQITGEYGCKDSYFLGEAKDYNPDDFLVASNKPMAEDSDEY